MINAMAAIMGDLLNDKFAGLFGSGILPAAAYQQGLLASVAYQQGLLVAENYPLPEELEPMACRDSNVNHMSITIGVLIDYASMAREDLATARNELERSDVALKKLTSEVSVERGKNKSLEAQLQTQTRLAAQRAEELAALQKELDLLRATQDRPSGSAGAVSTEELSRRLASVESGTVHDGPEISPKTVTPTPSNVPPGEVPLGTQFSAP